jgi:hypothetical protein
MNPSTDLRFATMIRAMSDVIIPSLGETHGLAAEQAQLVLGHLHVLRDQLDYAGRFEELEYRMASSLGQALVSGLDRGSGSSPARERLEAELATEAGDDVRQLRERADAIRAAIEQLILSSDDDNNEVEGRIRSIVIAHERLAADHNRTWFAAMGWESGESRLVSIPQLLAVDPSTAGEKATQ